MSFCSNCGAEIQEGQAICLGCGFALKGNAVKADPTPAKDYSDRVEHDVFKLWPTFNDGPVGRMEYFKKILIVTAVALFIGFFLTFVMAGANENNPLMMIASGIFLIFAVAVFFIVLVHQIALVYKRFWDMGFTDRGARVGMVVVYVVVGVVPVLNLACLAMFFIPGKGKQ